VPVFEVPLTRDATESTTIRVEADTPLEAIEKALERAGVYGENLDTWCLDEGNFHEVYIPDPDAIEVVEGDEDA